jgi:PIN domain nuclease of toxin-antitoxin system
MYLLDTMILDWLATNSRQLGRTTRAVMSSALPAGLNVSTVSFWEIGMLMRRGRLKVKDHATVGTFRAAALGSGLVERSLTGEIVVAADALVDFHQDPGDRFITATAIVIGATLITSDDKILEWRGALKRLDART